MLLKKSLSKTPTLTPAPVIFRLSVGFGNLVSFSDTCGFISGTEGLFVLFSSVGNIGFGKFWLFSPTILVVPLLFPLFPVPPVPAVFPGNEGNVGVGAVPAV